MKKKCLALCLSLTLALSGACLAPGEEPGEDIEAAQDLSPEAGLAFYEAMAELKKLLASEEIHELLDYAKEHEEVEDLILSLTAWGTSFMKEEPELSREILKTLEVSEEILWLFDFYQEHERQWQVMWTAFMETEEGKNLLAEAGEYLDAEQMDELIDTIGTYPTGE